MFSKITSIAIAILFLSNSCLAAGPLGVNLGTAANYAILAKTGISTVPSSAITGDIGVSPAALAALTGFSLVQDTTGTFATSTQLTGKAYAANLKSPTPAILTAAISDMQSAYTNAAGRTNPQFINLGAGAIGGFTLTPGLYKWTTGVSISSPVTISGLPTDTWIFQIAGQLTVATAQAIVLKGGASAANIVWVVAGAVTLGKSSVFEGSILGATSITLQTGATINGRLLAQSAVVLQQATVTKPGLI